MLPKKGYFIAREREMDMVPEIWNSLSETHTNTKKWHGIKISSFNTFFINRKCICIYNQDELNEIGKFLLNKYITTPPYFNKVKRLHTPYGLKAEKLVRKVLLNQSAIRTAPALKYLSSLKKAWINFDQVNVLPWFLGADFLREYIIGQLTHKYGATPEDIDLLCAADKLSLPAQEELKSYKAALASKKGTDTAKSASLLSKEFGWIPFGYDGPNFWDHVYFQKKIKLLSKKPIGQLQKKILAIENQAQKTRHTQSVILKKYKLGAPTLRLLVILRELFVLTDERKKFQFQIHYAYHKVLDILGPVYNMSQLELKYLETDEILAMSKNHKYKYFKNLAQKRIKNPVCIYTSNGKIKKIYVGKSAEARLDKLAHKGKDLTELSGQVANKSKQIFLRGTVQKIMLSRDSHTMKKGNILVTSMTTPDFVQAMRLAKAIITDEGGVTSHAAIVSRELGIPCIIGTKIATQILQNGDTVEINTQKATIKKIK